MSDSIDADLVRKVMGSVRLPISPTPAEFRDFLSEAVRNMLSHSWLVFGDNRRILEAVQAYLPKMTDQQLIDLMTCVPPS